MLFRSSGEIAATRIARNMTFADDGKIRPVAVTSAKRLASLPQVPTFAEAGYPQVTVSNWMGYVAPKGTPPAITAKLQAAFAKATGKVDEKWLASPIGAYLKKVIAAAR